MSGLGIIYTGSASHHWVLGQQQYSRYFDRAIYLLDLPDTPLDDLGGLVVPCRIHQQRLYANADRVLSILNRGGTVLLFGEQPRAWLPGLRWERRPTNFWWWREGGKSGLVAAQPDHSLFDYMTLADATWHYHGTFQPPVGADRVIDTEDGGTVLYVDRVSTPGTLIVTSLDPMFHVGSHFMPAAARFLERCLPWLTERMLPRTASTTV